MLSRCHKIVDNKEIKCSNYLCNKRVNLEGLSKGFVECLDCRHNIKVNTWRKCKKCGAFSSGYYCC